MNEALKELSQEQCKFIENEFQITIEALKNMNEDELYEIYEKLCIIEEITTVEAISEDKPLSERGETASGIVTVLGNALAEANGYFNENDD